MIPALDRGSTKSARQRPHLYRSVVLRYDSPNDWITRYCRLRSQTKHTVAYEYRPLSETSPLIGFPSWNRLLGVRYFSPIDLSFLDWIRPPNHFVERGPWGDHGVH